jgi:RND family efflux transporter MFP subunit
MNFRRTDFQRFCLLIGGLLLSGSLAARDFPATSEWGSKLTLATTVNGMVSKVHVAVGDTVAQGALLLELDPRSYRARLAAAESRREANRLLHEEAQRELERTLELYDRTLISDHERKLAEIEASRAEAAFREADAKLVEARQLWDYSRLTAPIDGRVLELYVQAGETVVNRLEAVPLVTLVDPRNMLARTEVDERTMTHLTVGDRVQVGVRGKWLDGEISTIGFDPVSRSTDGAGYRVDVAFTPAAKMELRSGETLVIRLPDE